MTNHDHNALLTLWYSAGGDPIARIDACKVGPAGL